MDKRNIKGIRIRTVNLIMLFLSMLLFAIVFYTTVQIAHEYKETIKAMNNYMEWESAARTIRFGSDYLTTQARLYVSTNDPQYVNNYFHELYDIRSREKALALLTENNLHADHDEHDCDLKKALDLSNALSKKEIYAIKLVADAMGQNFTNSTMEDTKINKFDSKLSSEAKIERAREIMFNIAYQKEKNEISDILVKFLDDNISKLREEQKIQSGELGRVLEHERIMLIILCLLNILTFAMIIILIVRPLKVYLKCIQDDKMLEVIGAYEFKHLALTYNDIFALKEHQDKMLRHKAEHDELTGLFNRAAFESIKAMLKDSDKPIGLLLVDVDKFKQINDTWGHLAGDQALKRVATQLQSNFRSDDFCIRIGGDEFAVIFSASDNSMEKIIMEKIKNINYDLLHPQGNEPPVSLSVGGVISIRGFNDNLYKEADKALYIVKEAGRCGCRFYHNESTPKTDKQNAF